MEEENYVFYNRLKDLISESGLSANKIERDLGYPRNTLQNYKNGQEPSAARLKEISKYFGVTIEYLIGDNEASKVMPLDIFFEKLSLDQKKELTILCQKWVMTSISTNSDNK